MIAVFKGGGIGPGIVDAALQILKAAKAPLAYECFEVGEAGYECNGKLISDVAFASFEKSRILLKTPVTTPIRKGFRSLSTTFRDKYDLYVDIRPVRSNTAVKTPFDHMDIVIFREDTEDLYVDVKGQINVDAVRATRVITRKAGTHIVRDAFAYTRINDRKKVACVHEINVLKMSDGVFLSISQEIAKDYPDIKADGKIMDNACMQLVVHPETSDIMVMPDLYGDIVGDPTSGLIGGLGLLPNSSIGADYVMFEAVCGSTPDTAGGHIADLTALLWSACMMLEHLQEGECAANIHKAVDAVLMERRYLTSDLCGNLTAEEYRDTAIARLS